MANTPAKGKPGRSTSFQGGKLRQIVANNNYRGGRVTHAQAATMSSATWAEKKIARDNHYLANLERRRKLSNNKNAQRYGRKSGFLSPGCHPEAPRRSSVYKFTKQNWPTTPAQSKFLCKIPPYREKKWTSQLNEIRVFVEGAEISSNIRGSVNWGYQSTSGMNTFRCTLNNDSDVFIITPHNVCAGLNLSGWRVPSTNKSKRLIDSPSRETARYDEVAKYKIYAKKYRMVFPLKGKPNIDATGMWLYPLNPYSVIFNKHDAIRAFTRMPHVTGVGRKIYGKREGWQLWMPIFTGFLRNISWNDDPVGGDRTVNLEAFDYKGLMNRMRVRTSGFRQPGGGLLGNRETSYDQAIYGNKKNPSAFNLGGIGAFAWGETMQQYGLHTPLSTLYEESLKLELTKCTQPPNAECIAAAQVKAQKVTNSFTPEAKKNHDDGRKALDTIKKYTGENWVIGPKTKGATGKITFYKVSTKKPPPKKDGKGGDSQQGGSVLEGLKSLLTAVQQTNIPVAGKGFDFNQTSWGTGSSITFKRRSAAATYQKEVQDALTVMFQGNPTYGDKSAQEALARINQILKDDGKGVLTTEASVKSFNLTGIIYKDWDGLIAWQKAVANAIGQVQKQLQSEVSKAKTAARTAADNLENLRKKILEAIRATRDSKAAKSRSAKPGIERRINNIVDQVKKARAAGAARQPRTQRPDSLADLYKRYVNTEGLHIGIFNDINETVARSSGGTPHPLANMSYEQASEFLICKNTNMKAGVRLEVGRYKDGVMEGYNRQAVFGILGRPYTYQEVTTIGKLTTSDYNNDVFAPINGFYNLVVPASGTGAATIVQADVSANQQASKTVQYATRLSLMQQISELVDFQWYINPMGDNCVEMPNYNIIPADFGKTFSGAYRLQLEWQGGDINEEATDLPTGWVFQGNESQALGQNIFNANDIARNEFQKFVIVAPLLMRRLGVSVEHVAIDLPGVGGMIGALPPNVARDAVRIWGLVYIQRQLGAAHTVSASMPFRPYLLPNRPMHIVPRQRIGLIDTVDFSAELPNGKVTASFTTKYVRWLFRDGTFRTMAGGYRQPVDYTGFFSGVQSFRVKEGVKANQSSPNTRTYTANKGVLTTNPSNRGYVKMPRSYGSINCDPALKGAFLDASYSYGDDLASQGRGIEYRPSPITQADSGIILGARIHRTTSNKARSEPGEAVTTDGTGLMESRKDPKKKKTAPRYDLTNLFYNPYPFGRGSRRGYGPDGKTTARFNNWVIRFFDKGYLYGYQSGARGGNYALHKAKFIRHSGIDIFAKKGTDLLAPINAHYIKASLTVGPFEEEGVRTRIKNVTVKGKKAVRELYPLMVWGPNGSITAKPAGPESGENTPYSVPVYAKPYDSWIASGKRLYMTRNNKGGARGLMINMNGRVLPPKLNNDPQLSRAVQASKTPSGLLCIVSVKHCAEIQKKESGAFIKKAQKGDVVGKVGDTGTQRAHAHVDMWLLNPVSSSKERRAGRKYPKNYATSGDRALFDAAAKANREYLETILLLKVTGGKPDSGKLSPTWQKYFKSRGLTVGSVREAVEVLWNSNRWFESQSDPFARKILTNAFFYFKPSDVVRGATEYDSIYNVWYSTAPLETTTAKKQDPKSLCGKLPNDEARKLFIQLQNCLRKAGKLAGAGLARRRRRKCRKRYKLVQFDILEQTKPLTSEDSRLQTKLDALVEKELRNDTNRRIPVKPKRVRS